MPPPSGCNGTPPVPRGGGGEVLARFEACRGQPVFEALGSYWLRRARCLYQSLPPQQALELEPREVEAVLDRRRVLAMQHPAPASSGQTEGLFVCRTPGFTLERLTKRRRAHVRKGQAVAELRRMDPDELRRLGFALNLETMERQHRFDPEFGIPARWAHFVRCVRDCPEASIFGAFVEGRLATYSVAVQDGSWLHGVVKMQRTQDLARDTSSALDAWILCEAAKDPTIEVLVNGLARGPDDPLYSYKRSLGFEVLPQRRVTHVHPGLRFLFSGSMARRAQALAAALPGARRLHSLASLAKQIASSAPLHEQQGPRKEAP